MNEITITKKKLVAVSNIKWIITSLGYHEYLNMHIGNIKGYLNNEEIVSTYYDESKDDVEKIKETLIVMALEKKDV